MEKKKRITLARSQSNAKKAKGKAANNPMGRPQVYNDMIGAYICREITKGRTITSICKDKDVPSLPTVFSWLNKLHPSFKEDFFKSYVMAREIQAEVLADEIKDIADDGKNDTYEIVNSKGQKEVRTDYDHIKRSALRVESRKWLAAHLLPRKFSDRVELTGAGGKDLIPAMPTQVTFNFIDNKDQDKE
jgi:hypothetical protein